MCQSTSIERFTNAAVDLDIRRTNMLGVHGFNFSVDISVIIRVRVRVRLMVIYTTSWGMHNSGNSGSTGVEVTCDGKPTGCQFGLKNWLLWHGVNISRIQFGVRSCISLACASTA